MLTTLFNKIYQLYALMLPLMLAISSSPFYIRPPSVARWFHRKVNPDDTLPLFYQQLIKVLLVQVADVEQYRRVAQRLFDTDATDIHGAARQMVTRWHTSHCLVDLRTSEPTVDDYRVVTLTI